MEELKCDVLVIGGGINGTGILRDLTLRGIKAVLVEKDDFSSGSTGASSGMIHGGLRYLMHEVDTTRRSCLDSGYIQRIAPFMLFRIPFITPVRASDPAARIYLELAEAYFLGYDRFQTLKRGKPHTRLLRDELLKLEPRLAEDVIGAVTMDEWGVDPFRLCALNALSAERHGARVMNHTELLEFHVEGGRVLSAKVFNRWERKYYLIRAKYYVNAAGPWLMRVAGLAGAEARIRPGKGVHLIIPGRIINYGIITRAVDGRQVFIMPHDNSTIIGTTDDDYYGDPDWIPITDDEVEYLLQAIEHVIPSIRKYPISRAMAGVRITLYKWGLNEDDLSREHRIYDHGADKTGPEGLLTIAGGKLASFRLMAEEMGDLIAKKLGVRESSSTHLKPLPGGEEELDSAHLAKKWEVHPYYALRLYRKYGTRAENVLQLIKDEPELGEVVCGCEPVTAAEIFLAVREEGAKSVVDVRRRTRLGTGTCQGRRCGWKAALWTARFLDIGEDGARNLFEEFAGERWRGVSPVVKYSHQANPLSLRFNYKVMKG